MKRKQPQKRYEEMNARELAKATAGLDRELVIDRSRELSAPKSNYAGNGHDRRPAGPRSARE